MTGATAALGLLLLPAFATSVAAQSFFEAIFGQWTATPPASASTFDGRRELRTPWVVPYPGSRWRHGVDDGAEAEGSGGYTTMCVRLCDGYYFPVSHRVTRARFYKDAEACRSRCGSSEAVLFYRSSTDSDMSRATDLTGRAYASLSTAFLHRKQRIDGCTCKPEPWAMSELARHYGYRIADEAAPSEAPQGEARIASVESVDAGEGTDRPVVDARRGPAWSVIPADVARRENAPASSPSWSVVATEPDSDAQTLASGMPSNAVAGYSPLRRTRTPRPAVAGPASWLSAAQPTRYTWPGDR
jgi:hypothetical protein